MENVPRIKFTAPNHCIITVGKERYFQSYESIVAKQDSTGKYTLGQHWDYSPTTLRHLYADFLPSYIGTSKLEIIKAIKDGTVIYDHNLI